VISGFLRYTFFHVDTFLAKIGFLGILFMSFTVLAGCTVQTGPPTDFTVRTLHSGQVIQNVPIEVDGTYKSTGSGQVWVVLEDSLGQYYLQSPSVQFQDSGKWVAENIRPLQGITEVDFVSVTSDGNATFQSMVDALDFGAFSTLPAGSVILQSVPIISQVSA
jgi:hypothetical protein